MQEQIKWVMNIMPKTEDTQLHVMEIEEIKKARKFSCKFSSI